MEKRITTSLVLSLALLFVGAASSFGEEKKDPTADSTSKLDAETAVQITTSTTAESAAKAAPAAQVKMSNAAGTEAKPPQPQMSDAEMMKQMMELAKTGDNHKLLSEMAGTWNYTMKMWMDPSAPPESSTGTAVIKSIMDGRFMIGDFNGKMAMPDAKGKMKEMPFKGMSIDAYDNVRKKFVSNWCDSMGTGMMRSEGTYDSASKTFTYNGEYEAMPGAKSKVRMLIKVLDKDHHDFEFYEDRGSGEAKTMEIKYTRKK